MYGYTQTGLELEGSAFASATGRPIPNEFKQSIIPSLLFGSLISATDPGTYTLLLLLTKILGSGWLNPWVWLVKSLELGWLGIPSGKAVTSHKQQSLGFGIIVNVSECQSCVSVITFICVGGLHHS